MSMQGKTVLVAGATGQQGGGVARRLIREGWTVRALTRNPDGERARVLAGLGADMVRGALDDLDSLGAALRGAYAVFSVQNFALPGVGPHGEVRQGQDLADAAKDAAVGHFVYSSVGGAERGSGIAHFESKWQIEMHIRELGLPATVLRPVAFMDNYQMLRPMIEGGVFPAFGLRPDKKMQLIALDDIAAFTSMALARPDEWVGKAVEIAGDELTVEGAAAVFSRVLGHPVQVDDAPIPTGARDDSPAARREQEKMLFWFNEHGYEADIEALRRLHPEMLTLTAWARRHGWGAQLSRRVQVESQ